MQLPEDPLLRELLPEFLQYCHSTIGHILDAAQAHNEQELYRSGHTLKGTALQFGLTELAELGTQLMDCARHHRWEDVPALCQTLQQMLHSLQTQLNNTAPSP